MGGAYTRNARDLMERGHGYEDRGRSDAGVFGGVVEEDVWGKEGLDFKQILLRSLTWRSRLCRQQRFLVFCVVGHSHCTPCAFVACT